MDNRSFDWDRDCGPYLSVEQAVADARLRGVTFQQLAEGYAEVWPFDGNAPAYLVPGMVAAMERVANQPR